MMSPSKYNISIFRYARMEVAANLEVAEVTDL